MGFFSQQQTWRKATGPRVKGDCSRRCYFSFLLLVLAMGACGAAWAQGPAYGLGTPATPEEIKAWDSPDSWGEGLPPGSGTAPQGAKIYAQKCAVCHGPTGKEGRAPLPIDGQLIPALVKGGGPETERLMRGREGVWGWPFATTIWDYNNRAAPMSFPGGKKWDNGSLSADEVYALTAWILYQNGIIKEGDVMDATTLPQVQMPKSFISGAATVAPAPK